MRPGCNRMCPGAQLLRGGNQGADQGGAAPARAALTGAARHGRAGPSLVGSKQ